MMTPYLALESLSIYTLDDIIFVYLPTMEYILATKIAAYRPKDADDIPYSRSEHTHTGAGKGDC
jgi:hypothetical protein